MRQAARRTLPAGLVGAALIGVCALVLPEPSSAAATSSALQPAAGTPTPVPAEHRALLDRYCVTCHNDRLQTGGLSLEADGFRHVGRDTEAWERVIRKLRSRTMPPAGRPRPQPARYVSFAAWLEATIDGAAAADPRPGRPTARRLNRTEYANAIRDLLGLEIDARALLPADARAYGFDNNADLLPMSTALLERYLTAAARISRLAVGDPALRPSVTTYNVSRLRLQDARAGPDLPFGSRGGAVVRHYFPLDAEYVVTARLRRRRFRELQQLDLRLDGERLELFRMGEPGPPASAGPPPRGPDEPLAVRRQIGALPHLSGLYPNLTGRENIAYYAAMQGLRRREAKRAVDTVIERLGIGDLSDRRAKVFSHGEGIRVALARSMVHRPQTVILDEPTNGLDVVAARALREVIRDLRREGRCILFSSHVMQEVAMLCDDLVVISQGRVAISGTPDEIRRRTGSEDLEDAFVAAIGPDEEPA